MCVVTTFLGLSLIKQIHFGSTSVTPNLRIGRLATTYTRTNKWLCNKRPFYSKVFRCLELPLPPPPPPPPLPHPPCPPSSAPRSRYPLSIPQSSLNVANAPVRKRRIQLRSAGIEHRKRSERLLRPQNHYLPQSRHGNPYKVPISPRTP
jgi:hypothetical protein